MANYKSFDDVLKELEMDEDELKRLVSEGQIRAFRDDDRMKFRSEDVRALARQRTGAGGKLDLGETQLGGEGLEVIEEETDETLLDLGNLSSDADFEDTGATSVPTVELSDIGEDKDATLTEELVFDETDELSGLDFGTEDADATQKIEGGLELSDDDELGLQTEPVGDEGLDELDELEEGQAVAAGEGYQYAAAPPGMPGPVQIQEQVRYVEIVPNEGIVWKVLTGITFIVVILLLITPPAMGMFKGEDRLSPFWGSTGYTLYLRGPNQSLAQSAYNPTGAEAMPFSAGDRPQQVYRPGMKIVRNQDGTAAQ
jgi:hypothetical protein